MSESKLHTTKIYLKKKYILESVGKQLTLKKVMLCYRLMRLEKNRSVKHRLTSRLIRFPVVNRIMTYHGEK